MSIMRAFTKDHRLQAFSVGEIVTPFEKAVIDLSERHRIRGKKLRPGPFLNALVLRFLQLPDAAKEEFAATALAELEYFLAESDEERAEVQARSNVQTQGPTVATTSKVIPGKAPRRRKGAG